MRKPRKVAMPNVSSPPHEGKSQHGIEDWLAANVVGTVSYIDSVGMYSLYLPTGIRTELQAAQDENWRWPGEPRTIFTDPCRRGAGHWTTVHQPTTASIRILHRWQAEHRACCLFRFHLATDFLTCTGADLQWLDWWFIQHLLLRWRRPGPMGKDENYSTTYWAPKSPHSRRNIAVYSDQPSKVTTGPCVHAELRFQRAQVCRNQGVHAPLDLFGLIPSATWERNVRISYAGEAYVLQQVRKAVAADRYQQATCEIDDKLRANIPRLVAGTLRRLGHDRAQWVKDEYPKRVQTTLSPALMLPIPSSLSWPDCAVLHGKQPSHPLFSENPMISRKPLSRTLHPPADQPTPPIPIQEAPRSIRTGVKPP
jgi:hypothetical protein